MTATRILLVDDDHDMVELLQLWMADSPYEFLTAHDGETAISIVREVSTRPSLVLLDLGLPGISGTDVCRTLKNDPDTQGIPILMFTGMDDDEERLKALKTGVDGYVKKTIYPPDLHRLIEDYLERAAQGKLV